VARKDGTGLGLGIAAELINAHGGQIALISNEGGATFRVIIPDVVVDLERARRAAPNGPLHPQYPRFREIPATRGLPSYVRGIR